MLPKYQHSLIFVICLLTTLTANVHAQLLHPIDLVVGRWGMNLHRKDQCLMESIVFPPLTSMLSDSDSVTARNTKKQKRWTSFSQCDLVLDEDGTFELHPPPELCETNINGKFHRVERQPLKGRWNLKPNPYCVTDRQYDELILKSNPKVRVDVHTENEIKVQECVVLEMHCKVWGRFGSNTIRNLLRLPRGRDAGRLTHGILTIQKDFLNTNHESSTQASQKSQRYNRAICASFDAKTKPTR